MDKNSLDVFYQHQKHVFASHPAFSRRSINSLKIGHTNFESMSNDELVRLIQDMRTILRSGEHAASAFDQKEVDVETEKTEVEGESTPKTQETEEQGVTEETDEAKNVYVIDM